MEAHAHVGEPNLVGELQDRISVLEADVLREREARELAEAQRDDVCHELVVLRTQAERLGELVRMKPKADISAPVANDFSARTMAPSDLVQLDIPGSSQERLPTPLQQVMEQAPTAATNEPSVVVQELPSTVAPELTHESDVAETPVETPTAVDAVPPIFVPLVEPATESQVVAAAQCDAPVVERVSQSAPEATPPVPAKCASPESQRSSVRTSTKMTASYWRAGMPESIACTICDKSSGGARLNLSSTIPSPGEKPLAQGDQITLTFESPFERTSVASLIMWINDTQCGVRYAGQFHTEMKQQRAARRTAAAKPQKATAGLFSGRR